MSRNSNDDDAFYNPYQFVPMGEARPAEGGITANSIRDRQDMGRLAHDHYAEGTLSGRIVCRLTTESEIVIGGKRDDPVKPDKRKRVRGKSGIVHPVLRDGRPLIPATGLRGCISSIAEAISFSAMRVQANEPVMVRNRREGDPTFRGYTHDFFSAQSELVPEEFEEAHRKRQHRAKLHQAGRERMPHSADRVRPAVRRGGRDPIPEDKELPTIRSRRIVTAAEAIFGFAGDEKQAGDGKTDAYRGRVRFSDALLGGGEGRDGPFIAGNRRDRVRGDSKDFTTLKALSEPKANVSANYFETRPDGNGDGAGKRVAKADLQVTPDEDVPVSGQRPLGRKFYLHGSPGNNDLLPEADQHDPYPHFWRSQDPGHIAHQKSRALPLARGLSFFFHIDFDNLSRAELGLLVTALGPDPAFRHKIGMGKPIGLGTVHIEIAGVFQVDRQKRYGTVGTPADDPFAAPRHHAVWRDRNIDLSRTCYSTLPQCGDVDEDKAPNVARDVLRDTFMVSDVFDRNAFEVLKQIGDPATTRNVRVHYPTTLNAVSAARRGASKGLETEGYRWFVENDAAPEEKKQKLTAIAVSKNADHFWGRRPVFSNAPQNWTILVNTAEIASSDIAKIEGSIELAFPERRNKERKLQIPPRPRLVKCQDRKIDEKVVDALSRHRAVWLIGLEGMATGYPNELVVEINPDEHGSATEQVCALLELAPALNGSGGEK